MVTALLLEARARDALGDQATAGRVLERALDITESNGISCRSSWIPPRRCSSGSAATAPPTPR